VVVVESNHDVDLLRNCNRPWALKQRIAGRQGHLSNEGAGELIADLAGPHLKAVFLAHLSADCNRPELALRTVRRALTQRGCDPLDVKLTYPDRVSEMVTAP
jgi:phosphoribosyl 1,2-cyclic phosphodiesterase